MICRLCGNNSELFSEGKILDKYNIKYFHCKKCNSIQTEKPYWLEEAYKKSINIYDTGIMRRNLYFSDISLILIFLFFNKDRDFLDYAGGHGIFVRLMRDYGLNFFWEDKYSDNLFARCFENNNKNIELITAFEVFEHFEYPLSNIDNILDISKNILFSTDLIKKPFPEINNWWYYGLEHGQHIFFYSKETLEYIAYRNKLFFYTNNTNLHILSEKKLPDNIFFIIKVLYKLRFHNIIKRFLKSKTFSDMEYIKNKYENSI